MQAIKGADMSTHHSQQHPSTTQRHWIQAFALGLLFTSGCFESSSSSSPASLAAPSTGGPDLMVSSVSFGPTLVTAGTPIQVTDTVENGGDTSATGFQVGVYLSEDSLIDVGDSLLGFRTIGSLEPSTVSSGGGSLTIPPATPAGTYFIGSLADDLASVAETNEANNARTAPVALEIFPAQLADLVAKSVSFSPLVLDAGEVLSVTERIGNIGDVLADSVVVSIYLSSDATITAADRLLGFRTVANLDLAQDSESDATLTVPFSTQSGLYYVGLLVDDGDAIPEYSESNNSLVGPVRLQVNAPPRPDLSISGFGFSPASVEAGNEILVSETVINQGVADAGNFRVGIYLSSDEDIDTADRLIGVRQLAGLALGANSSVLDMPILIPVDFPGGIWHVGAIVDDQSAILEIDEDNNLRQAFGTLEVRIPPTPDLVVNSISITPTVVTPELGETISVTDNVRNAGIEAAGSFKIGYYLSNNTAITTSDILIGTRTVNGLAVGDSTQGTTTLNVPTGVSPGSYFVGALADFEESIVEANRVNNALMAQSPLDVVAAPTPMPDLIVDLAQFDPKFIGPGGSLQVQSVVRNEGSLSAGAFRIGVYLSLDEEITVDDLLLNERSVLHLAIDFGTASSSPVLIPPGTAAGKYFVGIIADFGNNIAESNEENNLLLASAQLTVN